MSIKTYVFVGDEKEINVDHNEYNDSYPFDLQFFVHDKWNANVMLNKQSLLFLRDKINTALESYDERTKQ